MCEHLQRAPWRLSFLFLSLTSVSAFCQTEAAQDEAVGESVNYVFATDLGSGLYDMGGRTLQVYRFTYRRELRPVDEDTFGVRFTVPVTAGFFDFNPVDVISNGPPTRVDSLSVVPGIELDFMLGNDWHFIPYARAGVSAASSNVAGWLYGTGVRFEKSSDYHGWDGFVRSELAYAGINYREQVPGDQFLRLRHAVDLTRGLGWKVKGREAEFGLYAIFDVIIDPPTAPVADVRKQPLQAEFGVTFSTRPRVALWRFDAPRIGFGYRLAGELSAWHLLIGVPF